ncbi:unnamed protein product [Cylicostephanus goldi]|uniref:Uncharacterized protein n=1 Tax=Cylicostephanus goldi TaxID=71465 RepID=A0A3P6TF28_CYLGO|nr:unnamed protein product [Cylicostephanus goldi]
METEISDVDVRPKLDEMITYRMEKRYHLPAITLSNPNTHAFSAILAATCGVDEQLRDVEDECAASNLIQCASDIAIVSSWQQAGDELLPSGSQSSISCASVDSRKNAEKALASD